MDQSAAGVVREAVGFFRYSHEVRVELAVIVGIVEHRQGKVAGGEVIQRQPRLSRLDGHRLAQKRLVVAEEGRFSIPKRNPDHTLVAPRAFDFNDKLGALRR